MSFTTDDVITAVRIHIQDSSTPYRYSDATLLSFTNQALKRIAMLRPDLFVTDVTLTPTASSPVQTLAATYMRIVDIFYTKVSGTITSAVQEVSRDAMDRAFITWPAEAAGTPTRWARNPRSPTTYFLNPPPAGTITLVAQAVTWPVTYTLTSTTIAELSEAYFPALVDCVVFLAESIDGEHTENGRARTFYESFMSLLGQSAKSRILVDSESSAVEEPAPKQGAQQ